MSRRWPDRDSNPAIPQYDCGTLPLSQPRCVRDTFARHLVISALVASHKHISQMCTARPQGTVTRMHLSPSPSLSTLKKSRIAPWIFTKFDIYESELHSPALVKFRQQHGHFTRSATCVGAKHVSCMSKGKAIPVLN
jgi:hypothetical protein